MRKTIAARDPETNISSSFSFHESRNFHPNSRKCFELLNEILLANADYLPLGQKAICNLLMHLLQTKNDELYLEQYNG